MKERENHARTDLNRRKTTKKVRFNYRARFDDPNDSFMRVCMNVSEKEEIQQEKELALDEKGCLTRTTKQVFTLSVNQRSIWAAIGGTQILCSYTTPQSLRLYAAVAPHRALELDEPACCVIRGNILERIGRRFGIKAEDVIGDDDPPPLDVSDWRIPLIRECFARLMPAAHVVAVPEGYRYHPSDSPLVPFAENDPDEDDKFELERMCMFFNITNFNRIAKGCGLKPFEESVRKLHVWDALVKKVQRRLYE
jgi:hypothetical protein